MALKNDSPLSALWRATTVSHVEVYVARKQPFSQNMTRKLCFLACRVTGHRHGSEGDSPVLKKLIVVMDDLDESGKVVKEPGGDRDLDSIASTGQRVCGKQQQRCNFYVLGAAGRTGTCSSNWARRPLKGHIQIGPNPTDRDHRSGPTLRIGIVI